MTKRARLQALWGLSGPNKIFGTVRLLNHVRATWEEV
jgi:hypothetical protein